MDSLNCVAKILQNYLALILYAYVCIHIVYLCYRYIHDLSNCIYVFSWSDNVIDC